MSDGEIAKTDTNPLWLYNKWALKLSSLSPVQIVDEVVRDTCERVHITLDTYYTDNSVRTAECSRSPVHVHVEHEISFGELNSLIRRSANYNLLDSTSDYLRVLSKESERILISYKNSLFAEFYTLLYKYDPYIAEIAGTDIEVDGVLEMICLGRTWPIQSGTTRQITLSYNFPADQIL